MDYCMFIFVKDIAQTKLSKNELLICFPVSQLRHNSIKIVYFHLLKIFIL